MIRSFLTTGIRNLLRNKIYTFIAITGLGISITAVMFLCSVIYTELTHDQFHTNNNNIYRLTFDESISGRPGARHFAKAGPPAGPELATAFSEIKSFVRLRLADNNVFQYQDKQFYQPALFYVDSTFFTIFSFELKEGNKKTALQLANSIIISGEIALKYFGNEPAIGKVLKLNNAEDFIVTGVLDKVPANSHIQFDIIIPFHAFKVPFGYPVDLNTWSWPSFSTYFQLKENVDPTDLEEKFLTFSKKQLPESISGRFAFKLQPLDQIYFGELRASDMKSGNMTFVTSLKIIVIILLVLSSLNFINLNSTRLMIRGKESAVRKVLGASNGAFYKQFVTESSMLTLLAGILGMVIFYLLDDRLQVFFNINHVPVDSILLALITTTLFFCLALGFVSGLYPALVSARLEIAKAAKGTLKTGKSAIQFRRVLILLQFIITSLLIGSVVMINRQLNFLFQKDLGFNRENILVFDVLGEDATTRGEVFKKELKAKPSIADVAFSDMSLSGSTGNVPIYPEGNQFEEGYPMPISSCKPGWLELLKLKILAGHSFTDRLPLDSGEVVINETAARIFNWTPEQAIGNRIRVGEIMEGRIVGVVSDFNYASLHREIAPLVLYPPRTHINKIYVKQANSDLGVVIRDIETLWKQIFTSSPFYFQFLDDSLQQQYVKEKNFQRILLSFSILAMIIACTGIYAFVAFMVKLKSKETAIRKVLGGSQPQAFVLLTKPFMLLVILGNVVSIPFTVIFVNHWLNDFAFRININPFMFIWILVGLMLVIILTTGIPILQALRVNPVKFLREE